jgi:hypothetical protein
MNVCAACGKISVQMKKCPTCAEKHNIRTCYCSKECQVKDWNEHKVKHKQYQAMKK